ncbi:uncharacterized protein B0I36DRAFT_336149 [Microdochium trichocladiopsis]|uniref:DUF1776-domain-containing protein n=1 Tax=Microdochium trichocladiopsis TaxID=1682393 RepID=A0A9P9BHI7_9PEZI|nr:uncharacterized protein B0I36DRAFT_336149 [Microdochium trichocladiopsis]KAH7018524.1 hypothetical protein B0I36DRAFT_336149 [Microdochium trichocladiopsis]
MSADDQQFLDMLANIPGQIRQHSVVVAEHVDKYVDLAAVQVRDALNSTTWLPDSVRSRLPSSAPPPPPVVIYNSTYDRVQDWFARHKLLTSVVVVAASYATYKAVKHTRSSRKTRRAKRAPNGGRLEVVVIAGSPTLPLTKSLSLQMERKGFIVYVVCTSIEDEVLVQNLGRPDIKPFGIDITDPPNAGQSIERFAQYLQTPHAAVPGAKPNYLTLKAVLLIPSLTYQTSPIATIPPSSFADLFNTHLLHPILTIQSFLPLLTSRLTPPEKRKGGQPSTPKVLVFTPSIISSINPPFHAPEATVCSALSAFTEVLTAELRPLSIPVTQFQLGTFDFSGFTPSRSTPQIQGQLPPAETLQWPEAARHTYGRNYVSQSASAISAGRVRGMRGSSLRELHNTVFDVVDGSEHADVVRIGLGAGLYGFVGRWVPRGLVSWMMGIRRIDELSAWNDEFHANYTPPALASEGELEDGAESASENDDMLGGIAGSRFINVAREEKWREASPNVWGEDPKSPKA